MVARVKRRREIALDVPGKQRVVNGSAASDIAGVHAASSKFLRTVGQRAAAHGREGRGALNCLGGMVLARVGRGAGSQ